MVFDRFHKYWVVVKVPFLLTITLCWLWTFPVIASADDTIKDQSSAINETNTIPEETPEEIYTRTIKRADWLLSYGRYSKARDYYADALLVKPNDTYCIGKIRELNTILDRQRLNFLFFPKIDFDRPDLSHKVSS